MGPNQKTNGEYFSRANGVAPAPKPSTLVNGNAVAFTFTTTPDVAGFQTKHPAYNGRFLGDLTAKTVSANYTVTGASSPFTYYGQGAASNPCDDVPANVRLYFETNNNALGESQYWWSHYESHPLADGTFSLTANLNAASWSDRDGHLATIDQAHLDAFAAAVADVQQIGLSFGGGCFYANGVGNPSGTATFTMTNFSVAP